MMSPSAIDDMVSTSSASVRAKAVTAFTKLRAARLLGRGKCVELKELPHEIVFPAQQRRFPAAVALPGELDKVEALGFAGTPADEVKSVTVGVRNVGPTRRVTLKKVTVGFGHLFTSSAAYWMSSTKARRDPVMGEFHSVALRSSRVGCHYFGHWLRDDAATHMLAAAEHEPIALQSPDWPDKTFYKDLFDQPFTEYDFVYADEMTVYDDISQNRHKAERLDRLRDVARSRVAGNFAGHVCYLRRGEGGTARGYTNELEVMRRLEREGVKIVQAESDDPQKLLADLMDARLIISVEGSQLSHALLTLKNDGGVLTIQVPHRFWNSHYDWASALGMSYGIVMADRTDEGCALNVDRLLATIELMDKRK